MVYFTTYINGFHWQSFATKFVAKPDQLIQRRGKVGLFALNKT